MSAIIQVTLNLIAALLPAGVSAGVAGQIIAALIQIVPVLVKEASDLAPVVRNIITALKADPATTAEQLAALEALDQQVDQAFEAAATAAQAEDDAAG